MKQLKNFTLKFVGVMIAAIAFMFGFASCNDDTTTDSTSFALYYTSMTDISPTMTGTIANPTYKGAEPSGFSITEVTFGDDNQPYTGDSFSIDETTGAVAFSNTSELQIGKYKISVSCIAGGKSYHFKDAIVVNFMKAVPDGITVEPAELLVEYADIINTEDQTIVLPTAQVKTDGDHISITGYEISGIKKGDKIIENFPNPLFAISNTGEISVVKGNQSMEIGTYVLSLKLNTAVAGSDSEMGLFADAVKVNIVSKPLSLTYNPNEDLLEETLTNETEYISKDAPVLEGSLEGVNYSIASVSPATDKISIEPETGKIVIAKGHGFNKGESYSVNVLVKNQFCEEGVLFENAFKINIVEFIQPIENFSYPETTVKQALKVNVQKNDGFQGGGNLSFALSEEDKAKYDGILTLDEETGDISAPKYNSLEQGTYDIHVIATNNKGSKEAILKLTISENENYFTYISYGNNLEQDQTPGSIYDNQYRYYKKEDMGNVTLSPKIDNDKGGFKWSYKVKAQMKNTNFNTENGDITLSQDGWKNYQIGVIFVTASKGEGDEEISRTFPVFFHFSVEMNGVKVEYNPFVLHVNPLYGGRSNVPNIVGLDNIDGFLMDYRRTFNYYNINGDRLDGSKLEDGASDKNQYLKNLWLKYNKAANLTSNNLTKVSHRKPVSYFDNSGDLSLPYAYVDNGNSNNKYTLVVNKQKWTDDNWANGAETGIITNGWADGVFIGQMTFTTDGNADYVGDNNNPNKIFPIAIWFDKDYDPKK